MRALRRAAHAAGARGRGRPTARTRSRVGFQPGEPKRLRVDGAPVERLTDVVGAAAGVGVPARPAGARARRAGAAPRAPRPGRRRAVAGARRHAPRVLARRSAQRNALIAGDPRRPRRPRLAAGLGRRARPPRHRADARPRARRSSGCGRASPTHADGARARGRGRARATGRARRRRTPRSSPPSWPSAPTATSSAASPATGRTATTSRSAATGRELRAYGSRGQQRLGLLALLLAEREELAAERGAPPLMLLDDVMSELDARPPRAARRGAARRRPERRHRRPSSAHVPGAEDAGVERVAIAEGRVLQAAARTARARPAAMRRRGPAPGRPRARRADRRARARDAARRGPARVAGGGRRGVRARTPSRSRERDGEVTVACASAVWAQELDLLSERVVERLNEALGRPAVRRLRAQARSRPARPAERRRILSRFAALL